MSHIFISYSTFDKEYAHELAEQAEKRGFNIWFAKHIDFGKLWWHEIVTHIDTCAAFIVILTPHSKESQWVEKELFKALDLRKPLFPILLEGDIWPEVNNIHVLDLRSSPSESRNSKFPPNKFYRDLKTLAHEAWSENLTDESREERRIKYTNHPTKRIKSDKIEIELPHVTQQFTRKSLNWMLSSEKIQMIISLQLRYLLL